MAQLTIEQALQAALQHHVAGRLHEAEGIYRQILNVQPRHADALHLFGALAQQAGRADVAVEMVERAIAVRPAAEYFNTLANALKDLNRREEALASYRRAIQLKPQYAEAFNNVGALLDAMGRRGEAIEAYRKATGLQVGYGEAWINLGVALGMAGSTDEAIDAFRRAISAQPGNARAHSNLANALLEKGDARGAIAACHTALAIQPDFAEACNNLGTALMKTRDYDAALAAYQKAVALRPDFAMAWFNLGTAFRALWQLPDAISAYRQALSLKVDYAEAHENLAEALKENGEPDAAAAEFLCALRYKPNSAPLLVNLGNVYKDQGRLDQALSCYQSALQFDPLYVQALDNFVYSIHFHPDYSAKQILEENRTWALRHEAPLAAEIRPHLNHRDPNRRLKIGYVSPDFRIHAASSFLLPLLAHHDPERFEIYCYASVRRPDAVTARIRQLNLVWRDCIEMSDAQLASAVRSDGIDILIDLTLHMADNRLLVFARKPAPVQVTWLGYPSTTGLTAIDYRISDLYLDPPGEGDELYTEKTVRLPRTFWCYQPLIDPTPPVNDLPANKNGSITFGCFNNFAKVTDVTLALWGRVLNEVQDSRLIVLCNPGSHRDDALKLLKPVAERVEFVSTSGPWDYFSLYQRVDICLDPIPCPGHTSTMDALWMGVPTVTLAGRAAISRGGVSILSNTGLGEFIARTPEQYVSIASACASNKNRLADLRADLRGMLRSSPLMNAPQFAADMESAYRSMWRTWCEKGGRP